MNVLTATSATKSGPASSARKPTESRARTTGPTAAAELSFAQQRLWFLDQMDPGRTTYVIPQAVELNGPLNVPVLEQALGTLVRRHESLRTVFVTVEGQPRQVIVDFDSWKLSVTDLSGEAEPRKELSGRLREETARGFDLAKGPLFRARLYRLADGCHVLLLAVHHIAVDGWSMGILFRELDELYERMCGNEAVSLLPVRLHYRDFAQWQRRWLQGQVLDKLLAYWRSELAGAPQVLDLPADRPRPAVESNRGAVYSFTLPRDLVEALRRFAAREKASLFMPLLAGFATLLGRYTGQEDLLVGTPVAGRNRPEIEGIVGCFINTLVLRIKLTGDPTTGEFLQRLRQVCLDAMQHQDLPFERLVEETRAVRDLSRNPLVQVMFSLENVPLPPLRLAGLTQTPLNLDRNVTHVDLTLRARETDEGLHAYFEYSADLFDLSTIARMAEHWRSLLAAMVEAPKRHLSELPLLDESERRQLLVEWNDTAADYPRDSLVHDLLEAQAERTPEAIAASFASQHLSYRELFLRSHRVADYLRQRGIGQGARVGLCVERSLEMLIGLLGILKSGAAYVPLDPSFPRERLAFMAQDAQLAVLLTNTEQAGLFDLPRERQVLFDADADAIAASPGDPISQGDLAAHPESPAYVIYTSGSTGQPKGVVIPHRAVVNFLAGMAREPGLRAEDVMVAVTTLSFDIAVLELLLPLTVGASVVIASRDETLDGAALGTLLEQNHATAMQATPVTWRMLLETGWNPSRPFKALVGGEALSKELADDLLGRSIELWNMYGPTETTVWSTCTRVTSTARGIVIGKPIANTTIRILDDRHGLCPIGVPGELFIGGAGVSLGYWNRTSLTAERFVADPYDTMATGAKLYRTGDRARWRNDGNLEHLGRLDNQIKLRGFRIEPGEIEAVMAQHPDVREAAVIAPEDTSGNKHLVAYLAARNSAPTDLAAQLRTRLRAVLPEYMVPARFVVLPALPRTPNGKLDIHALPAPTPEEGEARHQAAVGPRNATEKMVVNAFSSVLGRSDFGIFDSFFDLGGHSLMAARLMFKLRAASGFDLPMQLLFERPTPDRLAEALDGLVWLEEKNAKNAGRGNGTGQWEEIEL